MVTKLKNFIDGESVDPADGATGEPIAQAPLSTAVDVDRAVSAARGALEGWAGKTPGERAAAMFKLADVIEENADELADLESADAGKPRHEFLEAEIHAWWSLLFVPGKRAVAHLHRAWQRVEGLGRRRQRVHRPPQRLRRDKHRPCQPDRPGLGPGASRPWDSFRSADRGLDRVEHALRCQRQLVELDPERVRYSIGDCGRRSQRSTLPHPLGAGG